MIAVNCPSSVFLLLREFWVFMYKASKKPQSSQFTEKFIIKLCLHTEWAESTLLPLWNLWWICEIGTMCSCLAFIPLQFDKDVPLAKLPSIARASGSHQPPKRSSCLAARDPCNLRGSHPQGGQVRNRDAAKTTLNQQFKWTQHFRLSKPVFSESLSTF